MCADTVVADQGLLIGGGINTLALRWGQNQVEDVLLVGMLRLFPAELVSTWSGAISSLLALKQKKIINTGAAGGGHLAAWPVTPGALHREMGFIQTEFQRVQLTRRRRSVLY